MGSPDATASMIKQVRQAMLVNGAVGAQLDAVGNNRGVPRPDNTDDDELYRRAIKALAWLPKSVLLSYYALLSAVFGTQAQAQLRVGRAWKVYEVNANEVVIELPVALIAGTPEASTYLHGASGFAHVPSGPTNTFTTDFDLSLSRATTIVGSNIYVETAPSQFTPYTVSSYSFSAGVATVQVSASTLPAGGGRFYLEVPGDGTASYRGDYVATGGFASTFSSQNTNLISVVGDATRACEVGMPIRISVDGAFQTQTIQSIGGYNNDANETLMTILPGGIPIGLTNEVFVLAQEVADTATTPAHSDRVYLTGTGLYQVVEFYLDLLVRAAGVKVRLEIV